MRQRRIGLATAGLVLAAGVVATACTGDGDDTPGTAPADDGAIVHEATIARFAYAPPELRVGAGDTVEWTNSDQVLHTVTSGTSEKPGGSFDGTLAEAGARFSFTFEAPGVYSYFCTRHTFMSGTVVVTEAG